jgi:tetratricopeptide (TPR) repeat protein
VMRWMLAVGWGLLVWGQLPAAHADEVKLADGGTLQGRVRREGKQVIVELDSGELRLSERDVVEVKLERSALHECDDRRAALAAHDVKGRVELARFCEAQGLPVKARALWQEVVRFDPDNAEARQALGHVRDGELWLTRDELAQKDGKVRYQGQWVDPQTMAALVQAQAAAASAEAGRKQAEQERQKAELELRAARDKAEAERAERERAEQEADDYAYWGYGGWYGGYGYPGWGGGPARPPCVRRPGVVCPPGPRPNPGYPSHVPPAARRPFPIAGVKDPRSY